MCWGAEISKTPWCRKQKRCEARMQSTSFRGNRVCRKRSYEKVNTNRHEEERPCLTQNMLHRATNAYGAGRAAGETRKGTSR